MSVRELGVDGIGGHMVKKRRPLVVRQRQCSFLESGHENSHDAGERTPIGFQFDVNPGTHEEECAGEEHEKRGNGQSPSPAHFGLDVHDDGQRNHHGEREREIVPVEEAVYSQLPGCRVRIELVRSKRQVARSDPAGSDY